MSSDPDLISGVLRRERSLVVTGLIALIAFSWLYLADWAPRGSSMPMADMAKPSFAALVAMWWLMMAAMMLPSATPTVLLYSRVRSVRSKDTTVAQTWVFLAGYMLTWLMFSIVVALAEELLTAPSMQLENRFAKSALLIAIGVYQLSPLKTACVRQCRSPAEFLTRYWRPGVTGAMALGSRHGAYCLGCCWMLMTLLFVGGVMNLAWVVSLTLLVAAEKLLPRGELLTRLSGIALIAWGSGRLLF